VEALGAGDQEVLDSFNRWVSVSSAMHLTVSCST